MSLHVKLHKLKVSSPKEWDKVKLTARGHGANSRNTVVAPGDLFIFSISSPLEAVEKGV